MPWEQGELGPKYSPARILSAYNLVVGILVFGILRVAGPWHTPSANRPDRVHTHDMSSMPTGH